MKKLILLVLVCVFPFTALAHPGKTDKFGGHRCLKDCEEWNLSYAEYHLHDKDGNAIRVAKRQKAHDRKTTDVVTDNSVASASLASTVTNTKTVIVYRTVIEENVVPNLYLYLLLLLLLLLLILRLARKKSKE